MSILVSYKKKYYVSGEIWSPVGTMGKKTVEYPYMNIIWYLKI